MRDHDNLLPQPLDSRGRCRREIIKPQKIRSRVIEGLEEIGHRTDNPVALLLADGVTVTDISRRLGRRYHVVWSEVRKLMAAAEVVSLPTFEAPAPCLELELLEVFAELQSSVPEYLRR